MLEEYDEQIKLAQQIFEYLDYVKESGLKYNGILEALLERNENDLFGFFKKTIDLYFKNQTSTIAPVLTSISNAHEQCLHQINSLQSIAQSDIIESINSRAMSYLNQMRDSSYYNQMTYYKDYVSDKIAVISSYAAQASNDAKKCCYKIIFCTNKNDGYGDQKGIS